MGEKLNKNKRQKNEQSHKEQGKNASREGYGDGNPHGYSRKKK